MIHCDFLIEWQLKAKQCSVWTVANNVEHMADWWSGTKKICIRGDDKKLKQGRQ